MKVRDVFLACAALVACGTAQAAMYKWVDENGKVQYTDRPPAQTPTKGATQMSSGGVVTKRIEDKPVQAEQAPSAAELERRRAETEQRRRDTALLQSYTNETEIEAARKRELQRPTSFLEQAKATLAELKSPEEKKKLEQRMEAARREITEINARFDGYKARFRELKS